MAAPAALAETSAYADARRGSLHVTSGVVLFDDRSVDLRGVWVDESVSCLAERRLRVAIEVFYVPAAGEPLRRSRAKTGLVMNCAEGGPNFGYTLRPRGLRLGCSDGSWRTGRYGFVVRTTHLATGVRATASLNLELAGSC